MVVETIREAERKNEKKIYSEGLLWLHEGIFGKVMSKVGREGGTKSKRVL